mmetsp:Transcript_45997/g.127727  ORF Transcript_45997/g.127727 Transcript_45997/m.127727 type:complete len:444 (-) Transcript_45997:391-1722(-)
MAPGTAPAGAPTRKKKRRGQGDAPPTAEQPGTEDVAAKIGSDVATIGDADTAVTGSGEGGSMRGSILVLGTYDGALLGLGAEKGEQLFGYAPHVGCVKAVHCSKLGRLASGGTDHSVRLFDLGKGVELGELQEHQDSVTCVEFWGITTLVTGGEDGQMYIWRSSDWELLLKFRAHKAGVASTAVHPSGRMMASSGRDRTVRLWDLTRGTSAAYLTPDGDPPEVIQWSSSGDVLATLGPKELCTVCPKSGAIATYRDPSSSGFTRVSLTAVLFLSDRALLVGDGQGELRILERSVDGSGLVETCRLRSESRRGRVKALVRGGGDLGGSVANGWFVAGFSSGLVETWRCAGPASAAGAPELKHFTLVKSIDTSVRLTCLTVCTPPGGARIWEAAEEGKDDECEEEEEEEDEVDDESGSEDEEEPDGEEEDKPAPKMVAKGRKRKR